MFTIFSGISQFKRNLISGKIIVKIIAFMKLKKGLELVKQFFIGILINNNYF